MTTLRVGSHSEWDQGYDWPDKQLVDNIEFVSLTSVNHFDWCDCILSIIFLLWLLWLFVLVSTSFRSSLPANENHITSIHRMGAVGAVARTDGGGA